MNTLTARDVASYIKSKTDVYGETQLQKLVYYAQCWSLAWDGSPLFEDEIQAWKNGPVLPALRHSNVSLDPDEGRLTDERARATVDAVLDYYARFNGSTLSGRSHRERPWVETRGTLPEGAPSARAIDPQVMRQWANDESLAGHDVPVRRPIPRRVADRSRVMELGRSGAETWARTLEILAR